MGSLNLVPQSHDRTYPANPLIAEPLYLAQYIERMGTGIGDMINRCTAHGLQAPSFKQTDGFITTIWRKPELALSHVASVTEQVTAQVTKQVTEEVTDEVRRLVAVMSGDMKRTAIQIALGLKHENHFRDAYLMPALATKAIAMTQPDSPKSPTQKYHLTPKGQQIANQGKK